jgi:hypothetical protein
MRRTPLASPGGAFLFVEKCQTIYLKNLAKYVDNKVSQCYNEYKESKEDNTMLEKVIAKAKEMAWSSKYINAGMERNVKTRKIDDHTTEIYIDCFTLNGKFVKRYNMGKVVDEKYVPCNPDYDLAI